MVLQVSDETAALVREFMSERKLPDEDAAVLALLEGRRGQPGLDTLPRRSVELPAAAAERMAELAAEPPRVTESYRRAAAKHSAVDSRD